MKLISTIVALLCAAVGAAQAQDKPEVFAQLGHSSTVNTVAFSPDGRFLASGSGDDTIKFWDVASGREVWTLEGHSDSVNSVAFAPDGKLLASGSQDHTIKLWEVATGHELLTLRGHSESVTSVTFSPDGKVLATGSADNSVRLWEVATGREIRVFGGHSEGINSVALLGINSIAFSPDGKTLASGGWDEAIKIWDLASGRLSRTLKGISGQVNSVAFAPNGKLLAAGDALKVKVWDVNSGRAVRTLSYDPVDNVPCVAFSADGRLVAGVNSLGFVHLWDVASGRVLRDVDEGSGGDTSIAFSPNGRVLARASQDGTIRLWDVASWREQRALRQYTNSISSVAFSPDGKALAAGGSGPANVWDLPSGRQIRAIASVTGSVDAVAFSRDGSTVATGGSDIAIGDGDGVVTLSDRASGRELRKLRWHDKTGEVIQIFSLAFSPDGRVLASGSGNSLRLWDVATGHEIRMLIDQTSIKAVAFSPDGHILASASDALKLWDVATGREIATLSGHFFEFVAFLPNGQVLAFGSDDGTVGLWDAATGRELRTISEHTDFVKSGAFSPDGKILAWGDGKAVKLWDVAAGRELQTLSGHQHWISAVTFSPDGKWLASGSYDGTVKLWDVSSGSERVSLITFTDGSWLEITPEGYYDASSAAAEEHLNVRVGDRVFGIASYRDKFFRPDLVKLSLAGNSLRDLQFATIDSVKLAPVVELTNLPPTTTNPALTVNVHITDGGGGIGAVRLYVNGTAIVQDDAPASSAPGPGAATTRGYTVQLLGGVNELRAVAYNGDRSMQSNPATAKVVANLPPAPRGTLHAIVVGIQDFKNPKYNLSFSVADAELFAQTLREHSAPLFEHTDVKLLTSPADTTREGVTRALKETLADVGVNDVFVFYAASHGVIDDDGAYYLITSNVDSAEALKEQALSQTDLTLLLANIPAPKKLVVMDTCHGQPVGDALAEALRTRGMTANTAAKIAARDIGLTVLAASTSDEEALEGYNKHGLFTYVVSDGLAGSADLAKRGIITNDALTLFVRDALPSLAANLYRHEQHPTVETNGAAFAVAKAK